MANFIEQPVGFLNSKKEKIFAILSLPKYTTNLPAVIICHGFAKNKSERKFVELARFLAEKGIASLRFDFAGQGDSEGDFSKISPRKQVGDLAAAFNFLVKQKRINGNRLAVVGHSLGALIAVLFQSEYQKANTLILLSPALQQQELVKQWYSRKQITLWQEQRYLDTSKGRVDFSYLQEAQSIDWQKALSRIAAPILIIHGQKDDDVPLKYSREILKNLKPESRLEVIENADHHLESFMAKKKLLALSFKWLEKKL